MATKTHSSVPLLALRDIIIFPQMVVPLFVGREKSVRALEEAERLKKPIMLAAQRDAKTHHPGPDDIFEVGTMGDVMQMMKLADGTVKVLVEGKKRARIKKYLETEEYFLVDVEELEEAVDLNAELKALMRSVT
ncbi:MAG: LON peptidase substrate-binding domain-containing protein, partial [Bdellovibrionales bacterium]|nr:LON peptidase substrate-binding domain-containing protein [Bdellovibrionales bacterium]